jgi:hypothetical protein
MDDRTSSEAIDYMHKTMLMKTMLWNNKRKNKINDKENPVTIHHGIYIVTFNWSDGIDTTFKDKHVD